MAALAGDLSKQIKGHSEAAQAFRPWWDNLEDNFMYSFVILGLVLLPMTFLSGTPVECTIHPDLWKDSLSNVSATSNSIPNPNQINSSEVGQYARFLRSYAKKYCTEIYLSPFLLYFPFVMMMIPMVLISVEKFFIKLYNSEEHLETLYGSLVKGSLGREDVANLEKENIKNSHEIRQTFRNSSKCYDSYLYRTSVELVVSVVLAIFFAGFSEITGLNKALFDCDVHSILFKCVIPNSRFFGVVYIIGLMLLIGYIAMTTFNLVWLIHPKVNKLENILSGCRRRDSVNVDELDSPDLSGKNYKPEIRLDLYYDRKGRDFRLVMNLLAEQSAGLAQSFRMLSVFDKHFQRLWRPREAKVIIQRQVFHTIDSKNEDTLLSNDSTKNPEHCPRSAWVLWNDCLIADYITQKVPKSPFEYTIEISPPTEAPIKSYLYHSVPDMFGSINNSSKALLLATGGKKSSFSSAMSEEEFGLSMASMYKYSCRFDGLTDGVEYTAFISTELDGKTITQISLSTATSSSSPPTSPTSDGSKEKSKDK